MALADYVNWSEQIEVDGVWKASPASADEVVAIANWAAANGFKVRALGQAHNWSPLVLAASGDRGGLVLVSTSNLDGYTFHGGPTPSATFGAGVTIDQATAWLQAEAGNEETAAPGYAFLNFTAPGDITIGGALAVGAHGTGLPVAGEPDLDGSLSNLVISLTAVVSDPSAGGTYVLKTFQRSDPDAAALLVHLGRAFITEATLAVVPNYFLQVTNWYPEAMTLFEEAAPDPSPQSLVGLLQTYGRVEVIWFPFTDRPWVKSWQRIDQPPTHPVPGPYNYPWTCDISPDESRAIAEALHLFPHLTPYFLAGDLHIALWKAPPGGEMSGTARDLLLYVKPTTALYSMIGYALQVPLDRLQGAANAFFRQFEASLHAFATEGKYPANGPVEIRVTTVDRVAGLRVAGAAPPALGVTNPIGGQSSQDVVLWVDSLSFPGTSSSGEFYETLESWIVDDWGPRYGTIVRPEWSKGWAYTASGPWTNTALLRRITASYPEFGTVRSTLQRFDPGNIYTNGFLGQLF